MPGPQKNNVAEVQPEERSPTTPGNPLVAESGRLLTGAREDLEHPSVRTWPVRGGGGLRRLGEGEVGLRAMSVRLVRDERIEKMARKTVDVEEPGSKNEIRFLQINAGGGQIVNAEICELIASKKIDIVLAQEPYSKVNKGSRYFTGLRRASRAICLKSAGTKTAPKAFVAVPNPDLHAFFVSALSTQHCVVAEVHTPSVTFFAVSMYFQFCDDIEVHLGQLEKVLENLRGQKVVIGIDANAESSLWSPRGTNEKGEKLERLIAAFGLHVVNDRTQPPTFEERGVSSYIDVTLVSGSMIAEVQSWKVKRDWTSSDHNAIVFKITTVAQTDRVDSSRFNIRRADWGLLDSTIKELSVSHLDHIVLDSAEEVEQMADALQKVLYEACETAIPRRRRIRKNNPWWTRELTDKKSELYSARRNMQQQWSLPGHSLRKAEYRALLRDYCRSVKGAKVGSWQEVVTVRGNEEPWGVVYKQLRGKLQNERTLSSVRCGDTESMSMLETANRLLEVHVPDDTPSNETPEQAQIRESINSPPETEDAAPFEQWEIALILASLKNNKAPGFDLLEVRVLKAAIKAIPHHFLRLFNACLEHGVFPRAWKQASLIFLPKGGKDSSDSKSYRPISLLPVTGKLYERLVKRRLSDTALGPDMISDRQFGFRAGMSTEDAIIELRRLTAASPKKQVAALLFDVKGAFDCIWRPAILQSLKEKDCPKNIYKLLVSYFENRQAQVVWGTNQVSKQATRGCPQGSVLGPSGWNLGFDPLLRSLEQGVVTEGGGKLPINFVAYADDLAVLVEGDSRAEIEKVGKAVVKHIVERCSAIKLEVSESKTVGIFVKKPKVVGSKAVKINRKDCRKGGARNPKIELGGKSISFEQSVRYLGVHFDANLGISAHCKYLREKLVPLFSDLRKLAQCQWGLGHKALETIYKGVFVPTVCYASAAWYKEGAHTDRILEDLHRQILIAITRCYRSTSYEAACVLAGTLPICIQLRVSVAKYHLRKGEDAEIGGVVIRHDPEGLKENYNRVLEVANEMWQARWEASEQGNATRELFFPDVVARVKSDWIRPDHFTSQVLTGHGYFNEKLHQLSLAKAAACICCGEPDNNLHFLLECPAFAEFRDELITPVSGGLEAPEATLMLVSSPEGFAALKEYSRVAFECKRQLENALTESDEGLSSESEE